MSTERSATSNVVEAIRYIIENGIDDCWITTRPGHDKVKQVREWLNGTASETELTSNSQDGGKALPSAGEAPCDHDTGALRADLEAVADRVYQRLFFELRKRGIVLPGCDTTDKALEIIEQWAGECLRSSAGAQQQERGRRMAQRREETMSSEPLATVGSEAVEKAKYILALLDSRQVSDGSPGVICAREILRLAESEKHVELGERLREQGYAEVPREQQPSKFRSFRRRDAPAVTEKMVDAYFRGWSRAFKKDEPYETVTFNKNAREWARAGLKEAIRAADSGRNDGKA
jgi:hypothetical protein